MYAPRIRSLTIVALILALGVTTASLAQAQTREWNVPSISVVDPGRFSLSQTQFLRLWNTSSGKSATAVVQGIYGLGHDMEIGLNIDGINERHISDSPLFMEAAWKWKPWQTHIGGSTIGFFIGDTIGIGANGPVSGHFRNFLYGSGYIRMPFGLQASIGPYHATHDMFTTHARGGVQVALSQPLPFAPSFSLVCDWQSGHGAAATCGPFYTKDNIALGLGYGRSNDSRSRDILQLITMVNF